MKLWTSGVKAILVVLGLMLLMPQPGHAIPAFARKFGVKCYTCHTVPPALNKNGYMFKRLGYRMPPDEMDGTKAGAQDLRTGQGHQVQPHQFACADLAGQRHRRQDVADTATPRRLRPPAAATTSAIPPAPASTWTKRRCSWPARCRRPASPTSATMSCTRAATTIWSRASASRPAAGPTAATSSRPARCTCRRAKERGQPCSTTSSPIPPTR